MQYLGFAFGAVAVVLIARIGYRRIERLYRSHRFRGVRACLDAVQNTLAGIEKRMEAPKTTD